MKKAVYRTTANLAQTIQKAGGTANAFGVDLEALLGHSTAIMQVSRESGNIVGKQIAV
ncbi:hypothetical protein [Bacillus sp. Marseille-P3800]|uniref:hypothetical protein n=1 Tax=Bacillus sp. Marseille-P3800 TaxID=2014782 RepID=UPI00159BE317|nr:hypothetical protein [Bacillus sp. Marseille-P3800]